MWFERSPFQLAFAQIKEEWERERDADGENGDEGQPAGGNAETGIFKTDEEQKRDRRNEYSMPKKAPMRLVKSCWRKSERFRPFVATQGRNRQ